MQGKAAKKLYTYSNVSPQNLNSRTTTKPSSILSKPAFHFCLLVVGTRAVDGVFPMLLSLLTHR